MNKQTAAFVVHTLSFAGEVLGQAGAAVAEVVEQGVEH